MQFCAVTVIPTQNHDSAEFFQSYVKAKGWLLFIYFQEVVFNG